LALEGMGKEKIKIRKLPRIKPKMYLFFSIAFKPPLDTIKVN
jgi:hypothetical protein